MIRPKLKICGLTDPVQAQQAAHAGVDYIGLVFHPLSKRYVNRNQARCITEAMQGFTTQVVGIFVEHSAKEILAICEYCGIEQVQLNGNRPKQQQHLLPEHFVRFYVRTVNHQGKVNADISGLHECKPERDFILFDSEYPGEGKSFDWQAFQPERTFRFGLAGGLNAHNLEQAILQIQPDIVDVSSGAENAPGDKSIEKISHLIEVIRTVSPRRVV